MGLLRGDRFSRRSQGTIDGHTSTGEWHFGFEIERPREAVERLLCVVGRQNVRVNEDWFASKLRLSREVLLTRELFSIRLADDLAGAGEPRGFTRWEFGELEIEASQDSSVSLSSDRDPFAEPAGDLRNDHRSGNGPGHDD